MSEREDGVETVDVQTVAVTTPPIASSQEPLASSQQPLLAADLGKVRELVLKAHPDVVPDLVAGSSVDELIASVEPARSAYQRIADQVRGRGGETTVTAQSGATVPAATIAEGATTDVVQPPAVPAGGGTKVVDQSELAPTTKIAQALAARGKRG